MPCKHVTKKLKIEPEIGGGSSLPTAAIYFPGCAINRDKHPDYFPEDCEDTEPNGPCPFWYPTRPGESDPAFR